MVCAVLDVLYGVALKLISCYVMYSRIHWQIVVSYPNYILT